MKTRPFILSLTAATTILTVNCFNIFLSASSAGAANTANAPNIAADSKGFTHPNIEAEKTGGSGQITNELSVTEQKFVKEAAPEGRVEAELGRIAAQKATHSSVKSFRNKMVSGHSKVNEHLKALAEKKA